MKLINHPSRTLVIGRSQSGKTTLAMKIIKKLLTQTEQFFICSTTAEHQEIWEDVLPLADIVSDNLKVFIELVDKKLADDEYKIPTLIVLDDVSYQEGLNERSTGSMNGYFYNAVWWNLSLVVICHRLQNVGSGIRENLENLILFQLLNQKQIQDVAETYGVFSGKREFMDVYNKLVTEPILSGNDEHPFMYISYKKTISVYSNFSRRLVFK